MTRTYKPSKCDFLHRRVEKFLVTIFFFLFVLLRLWIFSDRDSWKFLVTILFFLFFVLPTISRGIVVKSDKKLLTSSIWSPRLNSCQTFSSLSFFSSFFLSSNFCKLDWDTETAEYFSSLFCFFFFSFEWFLRTGLRQLKISRHYFLFSFFIPYLPTISRGIVVKSDKKL